LRLFRGTWTGEIQEARSEGPPCRMSEAANVAIALPPGNRGPLLVVSTLADVETKWNFPASQYFFESQRALLYQRAPNTTIKGLCVAHGLAHVFVKEDFHRALGYAVVNETLQLQRAFIIGEYPHVHPEELLPSYGRPDLMAIGFGRHVVAFAGGASPKIFELPHLVEHLAGSAPYTRLRIVAGLSTGIAYFSAPAGTQLEEPRYFAEDLISPHVCLTANGLVVAVSETGGEIYSATLTFKGSMAPLGERPLAVLPTGARGQFAVFSPRGTVSVYEV